MGRDPTFSRPKGKGSGQSSFNPESQSTLGASLLWALGPEAVPHASPKEAGASCRYTALGSSHLGTNQTLRLIPPGVW